MSRYPYTEACDAMRQQTVDPFGPQTCDLSRAQAKTCDLSRAQASQIRKYIAGVIGMDDHELACKIADFAKENAK